MKKLVMVTHESVFSGWVKTGMAEMVDSLANALGRDYAVTIICYDGNGTFARTASNLRTVEPGVRTCRFSSVDYILVRSEVWEEKVPALVERLAPDILHNFAEPELLRRMATRPRKAIYTIDSAGQVLGKHEYLSDYDSVTTVSNAYARDLLNAGDSLSQVLEGLDFHGITNGILTPMFAPEKGLLIPAKYTAEDQTGKALCKQRLLQTYGITGDPYVCLYMGRLVADKGIDMILDSVDTIRDTSGILVVVGKGEDCYENRLRAFHRSDGVIYVDRWASPLQAMPLAAGADFYLSPSLFEPCGLMPMTASRYGAVPIATQAGGLADNFGADTAILVDGSLDAAIVRAAELYADPDALTDKRRICMGQDYSWATRKAGYIELYEKEGA